MELYPLLMSPHFRHGEETPWGGGLLREVFGKDAPEDRVGESLEVSALPGRESAVRNGALKGKTLAEALSLWGEALSGCAGEFPLLLKLLDAREHLSVQVHPGDEYALKHEGKKGKSEAWVVLLAEPDAKLCYGLAPGAPALDALAGGGDLEGALNWIAPRPGDVFYIPNGTVHALGGGICCYEIQQPSDATYRIYDWGRVGADGRPREVHIEKALDVSDVGRRLSRAAGATEIVEGGSITHYICDPHFQLSRLNVSGDMPLPEGRMLLLTPVGEAAIVWPGGEIACAPFDSVVIPAALRGARVVGDGKVLCSSLPDAEGLRASLGYRAADVAGL